MRRAPVFVVAALACATLGCPPDRPATNVGGVRAEGSIELVESAPVETTLDHPEVANASDVWLEMIDHARTAIDFAEFYASESEEPAHESKLAPVLAAVERAVKRQVRVRFLADSVFAPKYPETLARLRKAGVDVRILDMGKLAGGVLHAKYFVVDDEDAYLGSQNFDWRALSHIFEMGVRVRSRRVAGALGDVFDTDWQLAAGAPREARSAAHGVAELVPMASGERVTFAASPRGWLPAETEWDLPRLVDVVDRARRRIALEVLTYKTKDRAGEPFTTLHEALLRAANRGVEVHVLVADWAVKPGSDARAALEELARTPNVTLRVVTIPAWSKGDIPFARVAHAKYLVTDDEHAWIGTSNWEGDYFTKTRNVGVFVDGGRLPRQLASVFADVWSSAYAKALVTSEVAPAPTASPLPRSEASP